MYKIVALFLLLSSVHAIAQPRGCAAIKDDSERLACFDKKAGMHAVPKRSGVDSVLERAKAAVRAKLRDPDSAKFGELTAMTSPNVRNEPTEVVCGTVNARNGYGGYAGASGFVYFVADGDVQITGGASNAGDVLSEMADSIYRRFCLHETNP